MVEELLRFEYDCLVSHDFCGKVVVLRMPLMFRYERSFAAKFSSVVCGVGAECVLLKVRESEKETDSIKERRRTIGYRFTTSPALSTMWPGLWLAGSDAKARVARDNCMTDKSPRPAHHLPRSRRWTIALRRVALVQILIHPDTTAVHPAYSFEPSTPT